MKHMVQKLTALLLAAMLLLALATSALAAGDAFAEKAYATLVTFSDCQRYGPGAYVDFGKVLGVMKNDGMPEPDSLLMGGDFTRVLYDYATPGMIQLREQYLHVYPDADPDDIICVQGNHDNKVAGFYPTGMYDLGTYCLFLMNEDDFPWKQGKAAKNEAIVKATAQKLETAVDAMIAAEDLRPVVVLTHVPLHHTTRNSGADNLYASYIFNVLNKAAEKLDVIFLFGHNHSDNFDDYIGGSVNYMAPGDTIRIPMADKAGENCYTNETLKFIYTNCGYIGYTENTDSDVSTSVLTLGAIRLFADKIEILKYTQEGLYRRDTVQRVHPASDSELAAATEAKAMERNDPSFWAFELKLLVPLIRWIIAVFGLLK